MKALTVMQPWAWAIVSAGKTVENRPTRIRYRGRIAVHAGQRYDMDGEMWLRSQGIDVPDDLAMGAVVGEVDIVDCLTEDEWFDALVDERLDVTNREKWGDDFVGCKWLLENAVAYDTPIEQRGYQGLWNWRR